MAKHRFKFTCAQILVMLVAFSMTTFAKGPAVNNQVVEASLQPDHVLFQPTGEFASYKVTLIGPDGRYDYHFQGDETAFLNLVTPAGDMLVDGQYKFEVTATPYISGDLLARSDNERGLNRIASTDLQSGVFSILQGEVVMDREEFYDSRFGEFSAKTGSRSTDTTTVGTASDTTSTGGDTGSTSSTGTTTSGGDTGATYPVVDQDEGVRDQVFLDDLIVDGSACVGVDCANGESFGFDTLRLKENNLRIKFQDSSSSSGSFPSNDWQITANDSANGGSNKFSVDDIDGGKTPFTIEAGAASHSLFVEDSGDIGVGTSSPVVKMHIVDGDSPTVRIEQNGSSGFTPQTWDLAGNETNFFIRDVTNGSSLPFRIRPGADESALDIQADNDIGMGTASPNARLHIDTNDGAEPSLLINDDGQSGTDFIVTADARVGIGADPGTSSHLQLTATAPVIFNMEASGGNSYNTVVNSAGYNVARVGGNTTIQVTSGDVVKLGSGLLVTIDTSGNVTATSHQNTSDVNLKEDFEVIDPREVLNKVVEMPVSKWQFKSEVDPEGRRHLGPMAQDFYAAFGLGTSDKTISTTDISGVAMAAIQGLNQKIEDKNAELSSMQEKNEKLEDRLAKLEALVNSMTEK